MARDLLNFTASDYLNATKDFNNLIALEAKTGGGDLTKIAMFADAIDRNLGFIEQLITAKIAEFDALPDETKAALDRMANDGVNSVEIELPGPNDGEQDETVIYAKFGSKPRGGRNDS